MKRAVLSLSSLPALVVALAGAAHAGSVPPVVRDLPGVSRRRRHDSGRVLPPTPAQRLHLAERLARDAGAGPRRPAPRCRRRLLNRRTIKVLGQALCRAGS